MPLRARLLIAAVVLAMAAGAHAVPYYAQDGRIVDIEYWAGTGANQSVLIVDFRQSADDAYAFGFRWDDPASPSDIPTGLDALEAIVAAGPLEADITYWPDFDSYTVDALRYFGSEMPTLTGWWPPYYIDGTDEDPPQEGLDWMPPWDFGIAGRSLIDRSFDGFVNPLSLDDYDGWDYTGPPPRIPLFEGGDIIPEPATIALLGFGALVLSRRRKRR